MIEHAPNTEAIARVFLQRVPHTSLFACGRINGGMSKRLESGYPVFVGLKISGHECHIRTAHWFVCASRQTEGVHLTKLHPSEPVRSLHLGNARWLED